MLFTKHDKMMEKYNSNSDMEDNFTTDRMQAIFGEALGDMPTEEETAEALKRIRRGSGNSSRSMKRLYHAAAILCLPIIVVAVPVLISHTVSRFASAEEGKGRNVETVADQTAVAADNDGNGATLFFEFDDWAFIDIVYEVADYYGLSVVQQSDVPEETRIHFRFPRQTDAAEVAEALNDLHVATLVLEDSIITVRKEIE